MAEQPTIDPRYDPAFQRGYAAGASDADTRRAVPHVTSALQRPATSPAAPARAAEPAHPVSPASAAPAADAAPEFAANAANAVASVVHVPAPAPRPPWTNPFVALITVIGVAALGTGVWLLQTALVLTEEENGFNSQRDYWLLQWGMIASPVILSLGVCILVTVLVMCAVHWSRRPETASGD
jgi:hypothetical protein